MTIFALMRFCVPKGHTASAEAELLDPNDTPADAAYNYLGHDHLGTGRFAYNQAKAQTGMVAHDPYGRRIAQSGYVPYHEFTGKPYEPGFNAYYFPFRYYNPSASRWLAPDPAGLIDGPNVYAYVRGNPMLYYDPYGFFGVGALIGIGAAVGGLVVGGIATLKGGSGTIAACGYGVSALGTIYSIWNFRRDTRRVADDSPVQGHADDIMRWADPCPIPEPDLEPPAPGPGQSGNNPQDPCD